MRKVETYEDMYSIFGEGKEVSEEDFVVNLCIPEIDFENSIGINENKFSNQVANYFGETFTYEKQPLNKEYCKRVSKCLAMSISEYFRSGEIKSKEFCRDKSGEMSRSYNNLIEFFSNNKILDSDKWELIGFEAYEVVRRFIQKLNPYQRYIVGYESCSAEISRNFFEELDISARICSILKDNPWIEKLSKDVPEFGKELEIIFGGNDLKILHLTIVRSHFGHLLLNEYKDLSNSIRAILEVNDCNPNGYYKTLPMSENSQIIVLTILSKLLKEKYNIKTNKYKV